MSDFLPSILRFAGLELYMISQATASKKFWIKTWGMCFMAVRVVEFSNEVYKIRKIFA